MAIVGEELTTPEVGWKRIGHSDSRFLYSGNWFIVTNSEYYNGSQKGTKALNGKLSFTFTGTKLRIVTDANTDHSNNIKITIDGQSDNFSICSSPCFQRLSYEKTGLSAQVHTVELVNLENKGFGFSGIDVDGIEVTTNLTAAAGDSQVVLSWNAVDGATSYIVKRSTTSGGMYETIAAGATNTNYTDTSVTNGTTYYYVVVAVSDDGESSNSNEASATPASMQSGGNDGNVLLRITMNDSSEREYELTSTEVEAFIEWCNRTVDTGDAYYAFDKAVGSQNSKEYLFFEKIISFEVIEV